MLAWGGYVAAQEAAVGGAGTLPMGPGYPRKEAVPEHLDRTNTVAGPSVVCIGAVRSGAVIGGRLGGGGTAEVCTLSPAGG